MKFSPPPSTDVNWQWSDNGAVKAEFSSGEDNPITVTPTVTKEEFKPTCTENGKIVYTATAVYEDKTYTDTKTVVLTDTALGHKYVFNEFVWDGYQSAVANFVCEHDKGHVVNVNAEVTDERNEPTCEEEGSATYTAKATYEEKDYSDFKTETLNALGHSYVVTEWIWNGVNSATATLVCEHDSNHTLTENAAVKETSRLDPTFDDDGEVVYTATIELNGKAFTDLKTEVLPAMGHHYEFSEWIWNGFNSATAKFVCQDDNSHIVNKTATISAERTEPTCETDGQVEYTAIVEFNGQNYTDVKTEVLTATGHNYSLTKWTWNNYESATALFVCANDNTHTENAEAEITSERTEPTCEEDGQILYTAAVIFDGQNYTDVKAEVLTAIGHNYSLTEWTWDNYESATALFTCANDGNHIENVTATITNVRTEPACEVDGQDVYTATVIFDGQNYTDVKTEVLTAIGHDYTLTKWNWTGYASAFAEFVCTNDVKHTLTENATVTETSRTEATPDKDGEVVYTATVEFDGQTYTNTKTEVIPAKGHNLVFSEWIWSGYESATAKFVCRDEEGHIVNQTADITNVRTEPTCEEEGRVVYTAKVTFDGTEYTDEKTEILAATGHSYVLSEWNWTGYESATVEFVCENDNSHTDSAEAEITSERTEPTCEEDGQIVYTATVNYDGTEYTDVKTEPVAAIGHTYSFSEFVWTDYESAEAVFVCEKDPEHKISVTANITDKRTEPTCEEDGKVVYTAVAVYGETEYTDGKTKVLAAIGHNYTLTKWAWNGNEAATAEFVCENDNEHKLTEKAEVSAERTEPTCTYNGEAQYTASVIFNGITYTNEKTETLSAIGHDYVLTEWTWNEYASATAKFVCSHDDAHIAVENAAIESARTEPTCEENGRVIYTASAVFENKSYSDSKTETLNATGHSYAAQVWIWNGYASATATFVCENDNNHNTTVDAKLSNVRTNATCTAAGKVVYTAKATFGGTEYSDVKTETLNAIGHNFVFSKWTWNGYATATAEFVCTNDGSHKTTQNASISTARTAATCTDDGQAVYTAKATFGSNTYTDVKTEVLDATGHKYSGNKCTVCKAMGTQGLMFALSSDKTYYNVTGLGTASDTDIYIPEIYKESNSKVKPVKGINANAFQNRTSLTSVTIPDSVTTIGSNAFAGCSGLRSVKLPDSITSINDAAFQNCTSLASVIIPHSVKTLPANLFNGCSSLTSVTMPDSVKTIGSLAFANCSGLTSITIPASVTSIKEAAFSECININAVHISDLAKWCAISFESDDANPIYHSHNLYLNGSQIIDLKIPDGVTLVDKYTFNNCSSLKSVTIPNSVTKLATSSFKVCTGLTSVTIPDSVTVLNSYVFYKCENLASVNLGKGLNTIGTYVFKDCVKLTSITIPDSVTSGIGQYTFKGCTALTSAVIGKNVVSIDNNAFEDCTALTSITIPDSVTTIGASAFADCTALTKVTLGKGLKSIDNYGFSSCQAITGVYITDLKMWCEITFGSATSSPLNYCPEQLYLNGKLVEGELVIPAGTTSIRNSAFYGFTKLTSVSVPDSVTTIGNSAFSHCGYLTNVTIGNGVTTIGNSAFFNCCSMTTVTLSDSVKSIGNYAFRWCTSLKSIVIGNGVTTIGELAFEECTGLTSVTMPSSLTEVGASAFKSCTNLTALHISDLAKWCGVTFNDSPSNPLYYAGNLFLNGHAVTGLSIPSGVTKIGKYAFVGCTSFSSVTIPSSVTLISTSAFKGCTKLTSITIPDTVTTLHSYVFKDCTSLSSVTIGKGITNLGVYVFNNCTNLTNITLPAGMTNIGDYTFMACSKLTTITFKGTKAQWNTITKGTDWNANTGAYTVKCSDGTVAKS